MMMNTPTVFCGLAAALFLVAGLSGCGYKTLPVSPQAMTPRPVTDLSHELTSKGAALHWTFPDRTVTNEKLTELDSFQLYRAEVPKESYCDTCPIPFTTSPITLPGGLLPDKGHRQGSYEEGLLRPGTMYFFKLRSKSGWLAESEDSNVVSFVWEKPTVAQQKAPVNKPVIDRTPPPVPSNVKAVRTATSVKIFWEEGTDKDMAGHKVYRRLGDGKPDLLGEVMMPYNIYEDKNPPAKGSKVLYSVSSVDQSNPPNESQRSAEASLR
jgi:hypothetical protein